MTRNSSSDHRALADLLPFYATGKLPPDDMQRIEIALAEDAALRRELALVEEEQIAIVRANEMLGMPSSRSAQRFFAALEAEPARTTPKAATKGMFARIIEHLQTLTPRQMAYAGAAAAFLLIVQAGYIGVLLRDKGGGTVFSQASVGGATGEGSFAMVGFMPEAKTADVARLLESVHAVVVDGPRAGGFFKVRIGPKTMPQAERDAIIAKLLSEKALVRFAASSMSQ
jgi:anti-sigma factor RsiW